MRIIKVRGHRRRWREISSWVNNNSILDLENLKKRKYVYSKIWIHPWSGLNIKWSTTPEPNSRTKEKLLLGLGEIYDKWDATLRNLGEPYYLKIWMFEPRISKSQVVCAIGDHIDYYNGIFEKDLDQKKHEFRIPKYLNDKYDWQCHIDYEFMQKSDLLWSEDKYSTPDGYLWDRRMLKKLESGNYRKEIMDVGGKKDTMFYIPIGRIWTGQKQ